MARPQLTDEERRERRLAYNREYAARKREEERARANSTTAEPRQAPTSPRQAVTKGGKSGNVVALGNMAWMIGSFPMGLVAPPAGHVMRLQVPQAGQHLDTLLKDTVIYDALTSGGKSNKAVAGISLFGPPMVAVIGHLIDRSRMANPDSPMLPVMEQAMFGILQQMMAFQGIPLTPAPRPARPANPPEPEAQGTSPPPTPAAHTDNGFGDEEDASAVAAAAASASRFDHVE